MPVNIGQEISQSRYIEYIVVKSKAPVTLKHCYATKFFDDFEEESGDWGNESGDWAVADGAYAAQSPSVNPIAYSSLSFDLSEFSVEAEIASANSGGLWLRFDPETLSGVFLCLREGGLAWRLIENGDLANSVVYNQVSGMYTPGVTNLTLRAVVKGPRYEAFLGFDRTPATTFFLEGSETGRLALLAGSALKFKSLSVFAPLGATDDLSGCVQTGVGYDVKRELVDPVLATTIRGLAQKKFINLSAYQTFLRDYSSGVLQEVTPETAIGSRASVIFIENAISSDTQLQGVATHLYSSANILPLRQL